jgi:catechol 2,3-dioxygenase-like lactoylglutathione lyase family enzyme
MDTTANDAATLGAATEGIDTDIYAMPGFVTFQIDDLARSTRWYVEGLGFVVLAEIPGPGGTPVRVHLRRHRYQDILLAARRSWGGGALRPGRRLARAAVDRAWRRARWPPARC